MTPDQIIAALRAQAVVIDSVSFKYKPVTRYTPISRNIGPIIFGQNNHNWGDPAVVAAQMLRQGCAIARYGAGAPDDVTVRQLFDAFGAAKLPIMYNVKREVDQPSMATITKTAGNRVLWWESLNEATELWTAENRLAQLKIVAAGIRSVNPSALICAPASFGVDGSQVSVGNFTGTWNPHFLDLNPWPYMDAFSYHPYTFGSPEGCWTNRLIPVAKMVEASAIKYGARPRIIASETGFSTGPNNYTQTQIEQYYSRFPWLLAASPYMEVVTFYKAKDDGTNALDVTGMYGVCDNAWNWKGQCAPLRDAFAILNTSTQRRAYTINGNWFVATDTPAGQYLTAWNPTGPSNFDVINGSVKQNVLLSATAVVIKGTFPEFS